MTRASAETDAAPVEAILDAATRLFATKGYDATSVREIAESARVAKPTIYYYFQSKEGLLARVLETGFLPLCESFKEINAREEDAEGLACMVDAVWGLFRFSMERKDLFRFIHTLVFGPPMHAAREAMEKSFSQMLEEFRRVLARAARQGLLDEKRLPAAAMALRGAATICVVNHLQGRLDLSRELAAKVVEGFLYGYARQARVAKGAKG